LLVEPTVSEREDKFIGVCVVLQTAKNNINIRY